MEAMFEEETVEEASGNYSSQEYTLATAT